MCQRRILRTDKVVFSDVDTKFKILQKAYKLKSAQNVEIQNVRIGPDRTPEEIKRYKNLKLKWKEGLVQEKEIW